MPTILKQSPKPTIEASNNGSVLSEAIPASRIINDFMKVVIYGENRVGKTTLGCQFPKPLLLISFEAGVASDAKPVKRIDGVMYLKISSTEKAIRLARELKADNICRLPDQRFNGKRFASHLVDGTTNLQDIALQEILGLDETLVQNAWGLVTDDQYRQRSEKAKEVIRLFRDLPAHTVFCIQQKDHRPPESRNKLTTSLQLDSFFAPELGGATVKWLSDACDIVQLYIAKEIKQIVRKEKGIEVKTLKETGKKVRRLRLIYHPNYLAGLRTEGRDTPEFVEAATPEEMYAKLLAVIEGRPIKSL